MGPFIILDKSALQSLSYDEIGFLGKHYTVVIPPVLIYEVWGDLSKYKDKENKFSRIADKLSVFDSRINLNQKILCLYSLLGEKIPMRMGPVLEVGVHLTLSDGEAMHFIDEPVERKLIRRWRSGNHTAVDRTVSQQWRKITRSFNMEQYKKEFLESNKDLPKSDSLGLLYMHIHNLTMDVKNQDFYFNLLVNECNFTSRKKMRIQIRWEQRKSVFLCDFAPYAYYCLQVFLAFHFGLASDLITTRITNPIDLEYLYYLPFCMGFCSGDKEQEKLSKIFLTNEQDFIAAKELKEDLAKIKNEFYGLDENDRKKRGYEFGLYPPLREESITYHMWKKHIGKWEPRKYGNLNLSKTDQKRLMEKMRPMFEAIKEYDNRKGTAP